MAVWYASSSSSACSRSPARSHARHKDYAAACQEALALTRGEFLVLLNTAALCLKVRQAGYTLACCRDLFLHHFGSRTFAHGGPAAAEAK